MLPATLLSPIGRALLAALLLTSPALAQPDVTTSSPTAPALPTLGDAGAMSIGEERELGDRIARELFRDPATVDDPILGEYIDALWQRLLAAARQRGELPAAVESRLAWRVVQIRDREVNAFALPGGYLGIQYGLISATQDRHELASVIAHELSHVTQRHIARMLDQQARLSPLMLATLIVGAIAATKSPAAGQALMVGGQAAGIQQGLNFSRDMEREADRIGYAVLTQAGLDPAGPVRMFERLQAASRLNDSGAWPYLRTHPLTTERIGDMQSRQARLPRAAPPEDLVHRLMAARAKVLAETDVDALRRDARLPAAAELARQSRAQRAGALYQAAMAQAALRDWRRARATADALAQLVADDPAGLQQVRWLQADLALRADDPEAALRWLGHDTPAPASGEPAPARRGQRVLLSAADVLGPETSGSEHASVPPRSTPGQTGRTERLWRAMAELRLGRADRAASSLQAWVATHREDALAWQTLAQAWELQGQRLRALRAQAEAQIAQLDWTGARDRLQAAQELSRHPQAAAADHIEASIVDLRMQQVNAHIKAQFEADAKRK